MQEQTKNDELSVYRVGKLTLLQLMAGLAILGLIAAFAAHWYLSWQ